MLKRLMSVLLVILSLQGCNTVPVLFNKPEVSVRDVALQRLSLQQGSALIQMNITNPNPFPIPLHGIRYGLTLNGRQVADGAQSHQRSIQPQETVTIAIPVNMNMSKLFQVIPTALQQGRADYELQGEISLPLINVPFSRRGGIGV